MRNTKLKFPPIEVLKHYFRVDEHSRLQRRTARHGWVIASKLMKGQRYYSVGFEGKRYPAHRIIWAMHHGREPDGVIDHINGKKWDNRIENLRDVTHAQNSWNIVRNRVGASGYLNVSKVHGGYQAVVTANYTIHRSPIFDDAEFAGLVADEMRRKLHGQFMRGAA